MGRLAVLLFVVLAFSTPHAQQGPVFRGGADNVPVFVTVTGKSGRLLTDLTKADFQVSDNGKTQPIAVFDKTPQPIRLIVLVDVSGSMAGNLTLLRAASRQLIASLGPGDLARVGTFGETIDISPVFTRDAAELTRALPTAIPQNAPTPLWRAIDTAIGEFGDAPGRRVVLVMSDGKDSGPRFGQKWMTQIDVSERAQREDVMIYGVGVHGRGNLQGGNLRDALVGGLPDPNLGTVANETGGGYLEMRARDDLGATFAQVLEELHSQYLLGFAPPARDGKTHKIEVDVTVKDAKVRARKTYRAR